MLKSWDIGLTDCCALSSSDWASSTRTLASRPARGLEDCMMDSLIWASATVVTSAHCLSTAATLSSLSVSSLFPSLSSTSASFHPLLLLNLQLFCLSCFLSSHLLHSAGFTACFLPALGEFYLAVHCSMRTLEGYSPPNPPPCFCMLAHVGPLMIVSCMRQELLYCCLFSTVFFSPQCFIAVTHFNHQGWSLWWSLQVFISTLEHYWST